MNKFFVFWLCTLGAMILNATHAQGTTDKKVFLTMVGGRAKGPVVQIFG